jgi:hypothetical protein
LFEVSYAARKVDAQFQDALNHLARLNSSSRRAKRVRE